MNTSTSGKCIHQVIRLYQSNNKDLQKNKKILIPYNIYRCTPNTASHSRIYSTSLASIFTKGYLPLTLYRVINYPLLFIKGKTKTSKTWQALKIKAQVTSYLLR